MDFDKRGGWEIELTFGTDAHLVLCVVLEETLDTAAWELECCKSE